VTWIPMDTRLGEHAKTLTMASQLSMEPRLVVGHLHDLWSRLSELDAEVLEMAPAAIELGYRYPDGFISAMVKVGWAKPVTGGMRFKTRINEARERANIRKERARKGAEAMHDKRRKQELSKAQACSKHASSSAYTVLEHATVQDSTRQDSTSQDTSEQGEARPPEGGEAVFSPAAALREVLRSSTPSTERKPDVLAQLRTLSDQTNGSQPELTDGTHGSVEAFAAGGC